jgi:F-type H+-transporting ATPase subunit alpha
MKRVAPMLRLELAQYRELEVFAKIGTELDSRTRATLLRGRALSNDLVQRRFRVYRLWEEVALLKAATLGRFDGMTREEVLETAEKLLKYLSAECHDLVEDLEREKDFKGEMEVKLTSAIERFFSEREGRG